MASDKIVYNSYSGLIIKLIKALQSHNATVEKVKKNKILDKRMAKVSN